VFDNFEDECDHRVCHLATADDCPSRALSHRFILLKSKTDSADGLSLSASSFYDASLPCLVPVCLCFRFPGLFAEQKCVWPFASFASCLAQLDN